MKARNKQTGKRNKLKIKKQTVKDLTAPADAQRAARGGAIVKGGGDASFCGMNTPTYSEKTTCK